MKIKKSIVFFITFLCMLTLSVYFLNPSKVILKDVDYDYYHEMLRNFSKEERSVDTESHDQMRDYLVEELEARGLVVQLIESEEGQVVYTQEGEPFYEGVSNIYATLPSTNRTEQTKNIVFASHYDSVLESYGAADAGLPVISFFAGLDSILQEERVNDISILITDHEESGLVGARYIADNHPEIMAEFDFIYNWEARGTQGNLILFETSSNDYQAVKNYIDVVDQEFSASIATAVYEQMPNGSDFTVFVDAGVPGLNFAIIEGFANYHTSLDHIDNIPAETFNNYTNNVVQIMKSSATQPFEIEASERSLYFNYFDKAFIFSDKIATVGIIITILCALIVLIVNIALKKIKLKQIGASLLVVLGGFGLANLLLQLPISWFNAFAQYKPYQPEAAKIRFSLLYNDAYTIFLSVLLVVAIGFIIRWGKQKQWITIDSMMIVILALGLILQAILYNVLYGGVVLTLLPLLVLELVYLLNRKFKTEWFHLATIILLTPLLYPILYYVYIALTVNSVMIYMNLLMICVVYFMSIIITEEKA